MTYTKPARLLAEGQEASLRDGLLSPLRVLVAESPTLRLDIRARSLSLYYRGASLLRLTGEPFVAELEATGGGAPVRLLLETEAQVAGLLGKIAEERDRVDREAVAMSAGAARREVLQQLAKANEGHDLFASEYVVVDLEYTYGKRRYDLIAIKRTEGVTGPAGFRTRVLPSSTCAAASRVSAAPTVWRRWAETSLTSSKRSGGATSSGPS